ncbi:MAG: hypothetical protein DHS20C15_22910 [Planctomycetota bacterium]|nr:MAG: hypothetical protein DHS20C15_22910 [Planctomycetota bacterium]
MNSPAQSFPPLYGVEHLPAGQVLVVAPHPDDEIIGCGGALALHCQRGDAVHVALVTGGEAAGDADERLAESRAAARLLGDTQLSCLGAPDGSVAGDARLSRRLAELVERIEPRVIYAPSPFEMHPDHVASLVALGHALMGQAPEALLLYEVNTESMASFLLDITAVAALKRSALERFASQIGAIDIVEKVAARNRARTANVDLPTVTHAEAYLRLRPEQIPDVLRRLHELAGELGLSRPD